MPSPWATHPDAESTAAGTRALPAPPPPLTLRGFGFAEPCAGPGSAVPVAPSGTLPSGPAVSSARTALALLGPLLLWSLLSPQAAQRPLPGVRRPSGSSPRRPAPPRGAWLPSLAPPHRRLLPEAPGRPHVLPAAQHRSLPQRRWHPALHGGSRTAGVPRAQAARAVLAAPVVPNPLPAPRTRSSLRLILCTNHNLSSLGQAGCGAAGRARALPVPFPSRTGPVSGVRPRGLDRSWL